MNTREHEQLESLFSRTAIDAVLTGDRVGDGGLVEYFVCSQNGQAAPGWSSDRAVVAIKSGQPLLMGLAEAKAKRTAVSGERPILRVRRDRVEKLTGALASRADRYLADLKVLSWRRSRRRAESVRKALEEVAKDGYDVWITGGLIRDLLREGEAGSQMSLVGDLDLAGSVPPGTFCERIGEFLGRAELPRRLNPWNGIVVVWADSGRGSRLFEYGVLKDPLPKGAGSLAFGSDPEADAEWRDLTVNTLCYDWQEGYVIDPTGRGRADLASLTLHPPGAPKDWPGHLFRVLFRYFKFMMRWPNAKIDVPRKVIETNFERLRRERREFGRDELIRLSSPFGDSPQARRESLERLADRLAPQCDWGDFFDPGSKDLSGA